MNTIFRMLINSIAQEGGFEAIGCGRRSERSGRLDNFALQGTPLTRSVDFFWHPLHLLTRKPPALNRCQVPTFIQLSITSGSSTQVTPGKVGEICLLHIMFLLETGTFRRTRPVCSNVLCIPPGLLSFFHVHWEDANPSRGILIYFTFGFEAFSHYIPVRITTDFFPVEFKNNIFHIHIFGE